MANCSSAFGTITVIGNKGVGAKFYKILKQTPYRMCYYTDIYDTEKPKELADGKEATSTQFNGCGRWAYEANIRYMWDWLEQMCSEGLGEKNEQDLEKNRHLSLGELAKIWSELKDEDYTIRFDFTDEEAGLEVLYIADITLEHKAGVDGYERIEESISDYEYTAENLVDLDVYEDLEEAREALGEE